MADRYGVEGEETAGSANAVLQITGDTTVRGKIYDIQVSADGTMEDDTVLWDIKRFTVAPTDTTVTPRPLDPASPAAIISDCGENGGTTGTITTNSELIRLAVHVRATYRWVAVPGGELVIIASTNGIVALATASSYAGLVQCNMHFEE